MKTKTKSNYSSNRGRPVAKSVDFSLLHWILILSASLYLFIFPFQTGLFNSLIYDFELPIYEAMLFVFIMLIVFAAYLFKQWQLETSRGLLALGSLLLPFVYWLSSFQAVASHNAKLMTLIYCLLAGFFMLGLYIASTFTTRQVLKYALLLSSYCVVLFGVLNLLGQRYFPDALWFSSGDYRLTSVFQYSNTYAGYLVALVLAALYCATHARRWYSAAFHGAMLVPIWLSLMLTYSRGALVLLPILILLVLPFMRLHKQVQFILAMAISGVSMLIILGKITQNYISIAERVQPRANGGVANTIPFWESPALESWIWLVAASLLTALVVYGLHRSSGWVHDKLAKIAEKRFSVFAVPVLLAVLGIVFVFVLLSGFANTFLPEAIANRLENINFQQHSVLERATFYVDAMKVVADYPLLGAGGGGWTALYEQYQNNPYISRQAHSYLVQSLVEVGWIGFVVLIGLIGFVYYWYIRHYFKDREDEKDHLVFFIFSAAILVHSLIDFDMSYVYVSSVVFLSLGVLGGIYPKEIKIPKLSWNQLRIIRYIYPSVLAVLAIILAVVAYREYNAQRYFKHAVYLATSEQRPLNELLAPLDEALALSPDHPAYNLLKADWYRQAYLQTQDTTYVEENKKRLTELKHSEPYERQLILAQYRNFKVLGEYNLALEVLEEGIRKFQWDINFYEAAIMEYALTGQNLQDSDEAQTKLYWDRAMALLDEIGDKQQQLEELPEEQLQGREFAPTPYIRLAIGQIQFEQANYAATVEMIQPIQEWLMQFDAQQLQQDAFLRTGIRSYALALEAIGQPDKALKDYLTQAVPEEQGRLLEQLEQFN
ncbi:O-antigen ligase family protein [Paenibacillus sp. IB182496]|uniref:O-antigen ligase family protein n=1 Tax=Paenibacillus sabuli TaxID=2772509 RepID=A0A927BU50_9BACL|nr:O-antigen ligase family protein [Paenibacillus sabuli]MBD2845931.1 O-antigen ligase family protein [Paenibacillus sabuli]